MAPFSVVSDFKMPLLPRPGSTGQGNWGWGNAQWEERAPVRSYCDHRWEQNPGLPPTLTSLAHTRKTHFGILIHNCGYANPSRLLGAVLVHFCLEQKLAHCGSGGGSGHSDVECGSGGICDQLRLT